MNEGLTYLFLAYTVIWLVLFFYLIVLSRKNRKLEKEIERLKTSSKDV